MPEKRKRDLAAADAWGALLRVHAALVPQLDRELQAKHHLPLAWYPPAGAGQLAAVNRRARATPWASKSISPSP